MEEDFNAVCGSSERRSKKMFDREYVWGVCCSGVVLLVLVLFLPVVAFGVPVKVFIDVPGGPAGFNVSSGIRRF